MSLAKLPTEIDSNIASCLAGDAKSLSTFSKTSRYYRTVVEPVLYGPLRFSNTGDIHIKRLLITLLDRGELAEHIRTVETVELPNVDEDNEWDEAAIANRSACETRLASYAEGVRTLLHEIATSPTRPHPYDIEPFWDQIIFQSEAYSVDGALALLLALAVNAEVVDIQSN
jgi:hypothetical protein